MHALHFGQLLREIMDSKGIKKMPSIKKAVECFDRGLTPEQAAEEIIKNNWWVSDFYDTPADN